MNLLPLLASLTLGASTESCEELAVANNDIVRLSIPDKTSSHLIMPAVIAADWPYDPESWSISAHQNHYFVVPGAGSKTNNSSVVLVDGTSYDIHFKTGGSKSCYKFITKQSTDKRFGVRTWNNTAQPQQAQPSGRGAVFASYGTAPTTGNPPPASGANTPFNTPAEAQPYLYSNYRYSEPVETVYDDGRFMVIRVRPDASLDGAVLTGINDEKLTYNLDHASNTLRVSGVYAALNLRIAGRSMEIIRE